MSAPRYWWYSWVKRSIMSCEQFKYNPHSEYKRQLEAIERALADTRKERNADDRLRAIDLVLFAKTHTLDGAALEMSYSTSMIQSWISDYIYKVGAYLGYEGEENITP